MTEPNSDEGYFIVTDQEVAETYKKYREFADQVTAYEEFLKTDQKNRPGLLVRKSDGDAIRIEALVDFLLPLDGPGASNESKKSRYLFEVYFLSKFMRAMQDAEARTIEDMKKARTADLLRGVSNVQLPNIFGKPGE